MFNYPENTFANEKFILEIIRAFILESYDKLQENITTIKDWEYLYKTLATQGIIAHTYKVLTKAELLSSVPDHFSNKIKNFYFSNISRNTIKLHIAEEIIKILKKHNCECIVLKGIYLLEYVYKDPGVRIMLDIDILVKKEDFDRALKILENYGYKLITTFKNKRLKEFGFHYNVAIVKNNVLIELHRDLTALHDIYRLDVESMWQRKILLEGPLNNGFSLSFSDNYLYLCIHLLHHINNLEVPLSMFVDILSFYKRCSNLIDINLVKKEAYKIGCGKEVEDIYNFTIDFLNNREIGSNNNNYIRKVFYGILFQDKSGLKKKSNYSFSRKINNVSGYKLKFLLILSELTPSLLYIKKRYLLKNRFIALLYYPIYWVQMLIKFIINR